jgi:hypothetical protein
MQIQIQRERERQADRQTNKQWSMRKDALKCSPSCCLVWIFSHICISPTIAQGYFILAAKCIAKTKRNPVTTP